MEAESREKNISTAGDDEFVVPHMDIACLQNSLAYQKVLEEPWTYLHNWNTHSPAVQQELVQNFLSTLSQIKAELAVPHTVFDPYAVTMMNSQSLLDAAAIVNTNDIPDNTLSQ
ncbi:hypothetical protein FBUS_06907 [Fasciolopsis buskii]|uniref:Uncharacterized protein n=1 Tax=Fasciolopsis buskii TaxID=27845 RepID=A0A8E0VKT1_9TREM|nr:hypothetical protein FBUS_06907 [Fasciolopsis buski]